MIAGADEFRAAIRARGLAPPDRLEPGRLHRFPGVGKGPGNTAGWGKLFADNQGGIFGDWSTGLVESWQAKRDRPYTAGERDQFQRQCQQERRERAAEEARRHAEAAKKAGAIWRAAMEAKADHPYPTSKKFNPVSTLREIDVEAATQILGYKPKSDGEPLTGRLIVVPVKIDGAIATLELIDESWRKSAIAGGPKAGGYWAAQSLPEGDGAGLTLLIGEGVATVLSAREASGHLSIAALSAGNLLAVAKHFRQRYPAARLVILADLVKTTGEPEPRAIEAAKSANAFLAVPDFGDSRVLGDKDFNDLAQQRGAEVVRAAISNARAPEVSSRSDDRTGASAIECGSVVETIRGSDVKPEAVSWLWRDWLALAKLQLIAGAPGTGKTTICLAMAATVTSGGRWPDGSRCPRGNVVIWSGEDDIFDTLAPRLMLAGANMDRIHFVRAVLEDHESRPFDPATDMDALRRKAAELGEVRLLIVDPIVSAIAGDAHRMNEVRRALQPMKDFSEQVGCAVFGVTHFAKGSAGRDPVERIVGSVSFGALARVVLVTVKREENDGDEGSGVRQLIRAKSNIGPDGGGFEYDLRQEELPSNPGVFNSVVRWGKGVDGTARELLATAEVAPDDSGESVVTVTDWLRDLLIEEGGQLDRRAVMKAAVAMGYKERTVHRAREKAEVVVEQHGFGKDKRSLWRLAESPMRASIVPIVPNKIVGTHGMNGGMNGQSSLSDSQIPGPAPSPIRGTNGKAPGHITVAI